MCRRLTSEPSRAKLPTVFSSGTTLQSRPVARPSTPPSISAATLQEPSKFERLDRHFLRPLGRSRGQVKCAFSIVVFAAHGMFGRISWSKVIIWWSTGILLTPVERLTFRMRGCGHYDLPIQEMVEKGHYNRYICCDTVLLCLQGQRRESTSSTQSWPRAKSTTRDSAELKAEVCSQATARMLDLPTAWQSKPQA